MNQATVRTAPWRQRCREEGIDPAEVDMVASRYAAYRDYMGQRGGGLPLDDWFRYYKVEKESEAGYQAGGVVSECTATGEATAQEALVQPVFLELLKLRLQG